MGGIGDVCTKREYQRKHYNQKLLNYSINYMKSNKFNISLLHASNIYQSYYKRYGFNSIKMIYNDVKIDVFKNYLDGNFREVNNNDINRLLLLYNNYYDKLNFVIKRDEEYYKKWIFNEVNYPIICYEENGIIEGSLCLKIKNNICYIMDLIINFEYNDLCKLILSLISKYIENCVINTEYIRIQKFICSLCNLGGKEFIDNGWMIMYFIIYLEILMII